MVDLVIQVMYHLLLKNNNNSNIGKRKRIKYVQYGNLGIIYYQRIIIIIIFEKEKE